MTSRISLPKRRNNVTQKVRIAGQPTLFHSVHEDVPSADILCVNGSDYSSECVGLYDTVACLLSMSTLSGPEAELLANLLPGSKRVPFVAFVVGTLKGGAGTDTKNSREER